ncbi:SpoIIE family protein phosphatase [Cellulosimicrobium arenosum]|uniref:SpoIIE family protein phosphatase n=1 Tax=Cellulosimicrobium arenosum TaxID=2708133 RepID=A0A927G8U6_9MICO|nr:SpoIIE family protein phosphatase [Cellulosimicrobium arenosum]
MSSDWFARVTATTSTGAVAAQVDWAATPLGPPEAWPQALRTAVELCFSTRFPVMIAWGPELVMIYNDGYRTMLGTEKHPAAMGSPARELWQEIWDDVGPLFAAVEETGTPTWTVDQPLYMERSGFREETYFTFSYSPLHDEDGVVRGVLDIATETTDQVVDRRRLVLLSALSRALQEHAEAPGEIASTAVDALRGSVDVVQAQVWLVHDDAGFLAASTDSPRGTVPVPQREADSEVRAAIGLVLAGGGVRTVGSTLVAALPGPGASRPVGAVVLAGGPYRPVDAGLFAFLRLVAGTIGTSVSDAVSRERETRDMRAASDALQRAMLPPEMTSHRWTTRYRPADDRFTVGGDWYDVVPLGDARWGLLVGDCVGHGLHSASLMGQLSSAGRVLLLDHNGPAAVLTGLDRFAAELPGAEYATVFCAVVDEAAGTLTYSSAGHPPGLVVRDGEPYWLDGGRGAPLTLRTAAGRTEATAALSGTDVVVLYTDGLVERRGESLQIGLRRLAATAREVVAARAVPDVADALVTQLVGRTASDDVAVVVYGARSAADVGGDEADDALAEDANGLDVGGRW